MFSSMLPVRVDEAGFYPIAEELIFIHVLWPMRLFRTSGIRYMIRTNGIGMYHKSRTNWISMLLKTNFGLKSSHGFREKGK